MSLFKTTIIYSSFIFLICGCTESNPFEYITKHNAIKGGEVYKTNKGIAGIAIRKGDRTGICTGTLISPNVVLTARHCVSELETQAVSCGTNDFKNKLSPSAFLVTFNTHMNSSETDYFNVDEVHVKDNEGVCGNDIAMLELNRGVNISKIKPLSVQVESPSQKGDKYHAVGYGKNSTFRGNAGTRKIKKNIEIQCGDNINCGMQVDAKELIGGDGTCQGDSGGAAISADQGKVIGVLSRGTAGCSNSIYTSIYAWRNWMVDEIDDISKRNNYEVPAWAKAGNYVDSDFDGVPDNKDNCPDTPNERQKDSDKDSKGNECDNDIDGDGVENIHDNCPKTANPSQKDTDGDYIGDVCDNTDDTEGNDLDRNSSENDNQSEENQVKPIPVPVDNDSSESTSGCSTGGGIQFGLIPIFFVLISVGVRSVKSD